MNIMENKNSDQVFSIASLSLSLSFFLSTEL
jgi:hypothetical protein